MSYEQQPFEIRIKGLIKPEQLSFVQNCIEDMRKYPDSQTVGFTGPYNRAWVTRKPYGFLVHVERTSEEARDRMMEEKRQRQNAAEADLPKDWAKR